MNNLLVLGGFTESKGLLEPVADAAIRHGFGGDAEVMTLGVAAKMHESRLRHMISGMNVITHSAGVVVMPDARNTVSDRELPEDVIIIAGPEPRNHAYLSAAAKRKTFEHIVGPTRHRRAAHLRVVAGNAAELTRHAPTNRRLLPAIGKFSTVSQLGSERIAANGRLVSFMMDEDGFYWDASWRDRKAIQDLRRGGVIFGELEGGHDELLVQPLGVLLAMREALDFAERPR